MNSFFKLGAAIHSKEILISNGDLDPSAATPSVNERQVLLFPFSFLLIFFKQYSIPELQILGRASLKNFAGIPLLQRKKRVSILNKIFLTIEYRIRKQLL